MPKIRKRAVKGQDINQPDEFLTLSARTANYVATNTVKVLSALGVVVVVIAVAAGVYYWKESKENEASYLLYKASTHMQAAERSADAARAVEELKAARAIYDNILKGFSGTRAVPLATYNLGNVDARLNKWDDAIKSYQAFLEKAGDTTVKAVAKQKIAYARWAKGDREGALKDFDQLLADNGAAKDLAHHEKARILEQLGRKDDAVKEYQAIVDGFKESSFAGEATSRITALTGKAVAASPPPGVLPKQAQPESKPAPAAGEAKK